MTVIRSVREKISSNLCEIKRIATPWSLRDLATLNNLSTSAPDRAAVGSSITSISASSEIALAISIICWSAIDSPSALRSGDIEMPSFTNSSFVAWFINLRDMRPRAPFGWRPTNMFSETVRSGNRVGSW